MSRNVSPLESVRDQHNQQEISIRCAYVNARGHRCTTPLPDDTSAFCVNHARLLKRREVADAEKLADELLGTELYGSRRDFAELFFRLFEAVVAKRISRRDGAILGYLASRALQCFPPLKHKEDFGSADGGDLNSAGDPIPPPENYECDANETSHEESAEEESSQDASAPEEEQSQPASEQIPEPGSNETRLEPSQPAPAPPTYVPPPNPHENPWGPYLRDPRPRHLRNLYPLPRRF